MQVQAEEVKKKKQTKPTQQTFHDLSDTSLCSPQVFSEETLWSEFLAVYSGGSTRERRQLLPALVAGY